MRFILSFFIVLIFSFSISAQETKARPLAPTFKVAALDGKFFSSPDLKGKIIVLNLWFVNCPHCIEEIKQLNKIVDEYQNNTNIKIIRMSCLSVWRQITKPNLKIF
ncbi:MAG: peroxiredoxin family protein [Pyrinomonadaceae bacterium]